MGRSGLGHHFRASQRAADPPAFEDTQPGAQPVAAVEGDKVCPFCAETIKAAAIVCRYCGRELGPALTTAAGATNANRQSGVLIACKACGGEISSNAKTCPKCGAKVPHFKWWLWIPLGLFAAFILYGLSIPEYQHQAREMRDVCRKMAAPWALAECDRIYERKMAEGKTRGSK